MVGAEVLRAEIDAFVEIERVHALWWLRADWRPRTDAERFWILDQIERRADRATFVATRQLARRASEQLGAPRARPTG